MLLTVRNLSTYYGRAQILHGVSLSVDDGQIVALLGRNGAGKSTTLKSIMGLTPPSSGDVELRGSRVNGKKTFEIARLGFGYVPEDRRIFTRLTVDENLRAGYRGSPAAFDDLLARMLKLFPNLAVMRKRFGAEMSGGEQQMLTVARALMGRPACLLFDEPFEGLSPVMVDRLSELIVELKMTGLGILLAEPDFKVAEKIADRVCIIESGMIKYQGTAKELRDDSAARGRFLAL